MTAFYLQVSMKTELGGRAEHFLAPKWEAFEGKAQINRFRARRTPRRLVLGYQSIVPSCRPFSRYVRGDPWKTAEALEGYPHRGNLRNGRDS